MVQIKRDKEYSKTITSLYRVMKRLNIKFYKGMKIKDTSKRSIIKVLYTRNIGENGK